MVGLLDKKPPVVARSEASRGYSSILQCETSDMKPHLRLIDHYEDKIDLLTILEFQILEQS